MNSSILLSSMLVIFICGIGSVFEETSFAQRTFVEDRRTSAGVLPDWIASSRVLFKRVSLNSDQLTTLEFLRTIDSQTFSLNRETLQVRELISTDLTCSNFGLNSEFPKIVCASPDTRVRGGTYTVITLVLRGEKFYASYKVYTTLANGDNPEPVPLGEELIWLKNRPSSETKGGEDLELTESSVSEVISWTDPVTGNEYRYVGDISPLRVSRACRQIGPGWEPLNNLNFSGNIAVRMFKSDFAENLKAIQEISNLRIILVHWRSYDILEWGCYPQTNSAPYWFTRESNLQKPELKVDDLEGEFSPCEAPLPSVCGLTKQD